MEPKQNTNRDKCLNPNCTRGQVARGLCSSCYTTAARLVREKAVTWEQLQEKGKALPVTYGKGDGTTTTWIMEGIETG